MSVRIEVLIGVWEIYVFWNVMPCTLVEIYQHFRKKILQLHFQGTLNKKLWVYNR